ncbi:CLUMA_CG005911, isoform A [Clunio marinus]|uniref:CLUMA_CG005911, isoform A n=1 Tax=Clunio marinus TaxID=568069 RepID=A0A1J1HW89_9DIPT|nr:CLUMA_CG005911, isoform A [Clunio marinus]
MALLRTVALSTTRIFSRNIRMSANMKEKAAEAMEKLKSENPYYEKYAQKIAKIQQSSPEVLLAKLDQQKEKAKKSEPKPRDYSELLNPKKSTDTKAELPYKKLEDLMKLDRLEGKSIEEIKQIWLEYHKQKEVIAAVIPTEAFESIMANAKKFPIFIFPIPRSQGYEFIMFQFAANTIHFTPLLCYQVHKENAPECLNIVHYTEFKDKGIVLMRGEYDTNVLTAQEAQCLANQLQLYYVQNDPKKQEILEVFTKAPENFKHMDVIKELENLTIS